MKKNTFEALEVGDKVRFIKGNQPHNDPEREYTVGCKHDDYFHLAKGEADGVGCEKHGTSWISYKSAWEGEGIKIVGSKADTTLKVKRDSTLKVAKEWFIGSERGCIDGKLVLNEKEVDELFNLLSVERNKRK